MGKSGYGFRMAGCVLAASLGATSLAAAPHVDSIMANSRLSQQADGFLATLKFAQSESVRREAPVSVVPTDRGWMIWEDLDRNGRRDADEPLIRARVGSQTVRIVSLGGDAITFLPSGFIDMRSTESRTFVVCEKANRAEGRTIRIAATGTLRVGAADCTA